MSNKIDAPQPGAIIGGKYVVEGLLGTGGMGVVLAARHKQLDQKVAIKLLLKEARHHPEVLERFTREARAAAKIHGEHVARIIDVGVLDDDSPFMVMEHLDGRDLSLELRARGPLPPGEIAHWIVQACEAIAQAHAAKIVHRDLKPGNLFLARQPDGHSIIKVLDFGISKVVDPDAPALTKTSSLVGTPYYMSPEQLTAAKSVDTRADIWALGVIMYELLLGGPPFTGESMPEVVASILTNSPTPPESIRDGLPTGFTAVISKCMQTKPGDRYANIAELAAAIAPFAQTRGAGLSSTGDRTESVARIARVLGIVNPYETLPPDTELAPPNLATTPAPETPGIISKPNSKAEDANPSAAIGVAIAATMPLVEKASVLKIAPPPASPLATTTEPPKTQLGVETSIPPKSASKLPVIIALLAAVVGAAGIAALKVGSTPPTTTTASTTATTASASASSAPVPTPSISAEPPSIPVVVSSVSATKLVAPVAPPSTTTKPVAAPAVSVTPPRASASAVVPAASSSAAKNPLDMGIK